LILLLWTKRSHLKDSAAAWIPVLEEMFLFIVTEDGVMQKLSELLRFPIYIYIFILYEIVWCEMPAETAYFGSIKGHSFRRHDTLVATCLMGKQQAELWF